jgi:hypothetical protein
MKRLIYTNHQRRGFMHIKKIISAKMQETKTIVNELIDKSIWQGRAVYRRVGKFLDCVCEQIKVVFNSRFPRSASKKEAGSFEKKCAARAIKNEKMENNEFIALKYLDNPNFISKQNFTTEEAIKRLGVSIEKDGNSLIIDLTAVEDAAATEIQSILKKNKLEPSAMTGVIKDSRSIKLSASKIPKDLDFKTAQILSNYNRNKFAYENLPKKDQQKVDEIVASYRQIKAVFSISVNPSNS